MFKIQFYSLLLKNYRRIQIAVTYQQLKIQFTWMNEQSVILNHFEKSIQRKTDDLTLFFIKNITAIHLLEEKLISPSRNSMYFIRKQKNKIIKQLEQMK